VESDALHGIGHGLKGRAQIVKEGKHRPGVERAVQLHGEASHPQPALEDVLGEIFWTLIAAESQ
jgi:hypothetical protein